MMTTDITFPRAPEMRALSADEIEAVSGGLDRGIVDSPYFKAAATVIGIGVAWVAGKIWDWLF